jgi:hypothetical protein
MAAMEGHKEVVEMLLSHLLSLPVFPLHPTPNPTPPLPEIVEKVMEIGKKAKESKTPTLYFQAIREKKISFAKVLLDVLYLFFFFFSFFHYISLYVDMLDYLLASQMNTQESFLAKKY